eukprot:3787820-Pleurochrysis_carterae.AAC.3
MRGMEGVLRAANASQTVLGLAARGTKFARREGSQLERAGKTLAQQRLVHQRRLVRRHDLVLVALQSQRVRHSGRT